MYTGAKILNKTLANQIQKSIKRIIHYNHVEFNSSMQAWFNIKKSIKVIQQVKRLRKNYT